MANRIKGITVEIGGDTTKLQTALKQVNTEIKHTQSELRDINKLLKLDPGNTELISQKHKLLGQTLEETKNKLTSLKEAQKQAEQALDEGRFHRMYYGRTYFRFFDVYDFNRYLSFILNLTTSRATPYNITVEGLVINDWLQ